MKFIYKYHFGGDFNPRLLMAGMCMDKLLLVILEQKLDKLAIITYKGFKFEHHQLRIIQNIL